MIVSIANPRDTSISMNALVGHPDVMRWFLWSWRSTSKKPSSDMMRELFHTIMYAPIDVSITNTTMSIFKDVYADITKCPPVISTYFQKLSRDNKTYFDEIEHNYIFKNIKCTRFKLNKQLDDSIDRLGWVCWAIWWFLQHQPTKFFVMKDLILVGLSDIGNYKCCVCDPLPLPPWIKERPASIRTIYRALLTSIYYECFES
jgi:hypothetical protein